MTDIALIAMAVPLLAVVVWLWNVGKGQKLQFDVKASLSPELDVRAIPVHKPSRLTAWLEIVKDWLPIVSLFALLFIVLFAVPVVLIIAVVVGIYLLLAQFISDSLLVAVLTGLVTFFLVLLLLLLFIRRKRERARQGPLRVQLPRGARREYGQLSYPAYEQCRVMYHGNGILPTKVYEGDSKNIIVLLRPSSWVLDKDEKPLEIQDTRGGKSITLHIRRSFDVEEHLEVELLAAGFIVEGEKKQRQRLTSESLHYQWNCYFPHSGNHALALVVRVISPPSELEVGTIEHTIKVAKLDHLTQRQVWTLATLAGVLSGGLAMAEVLHRLGVW